MFPLWAALDRGSSSNKALLGALFVLCGLPYFSFVGCPRLPHGGCPVEGEGRGGLYRALLFLIPVVPLWAALFGTPF